MKPVNHIFLFRCIMDMRNELINNKSVKHLLSMSSCKVVYNNYGCAKVDPSKRLWKASKNHLVKAAGEESERKRGRFDGDERDKKIKWQLNKGVNLYKLQSFAKV